MSDFNRVTFIGRCGQDPEHIDFESGARLTKFSLAVNRYDAKKKADITDWFKVQSFSKLGDYLKKGIKVCVDGRLETNVWQNKDGKNIKDYVINARTIEILTPKEKTEVSTIPTEISEDTGEIPDDLPDIDDEDISF